MENIETLLAAVAQTQGFDDDEPVVSTQSEVRSEPSPVIRGDTSSSQLVGEVSGDAQPSTVVDKLLPAPTSAFPAVGRVMGDGEKRKRGRPPKGQLAAKPPPTKRKKIEDEEDDVCFICFDGGSLVLCDRKGCPKAYHPVCIKRDEAFFKSKAKWNCGWHICSVCQKASHYMCYTCTYSLCKGCTKDAEFLCVRGNKGFCSTCMKMIMLIENKDRATSESVQVDFDDVTSWEYLFKVYYVLLKEKLSLTLSELTQAKTPWKGATVVARKPQSSNVLCTAVGGEVSTSCRSTEQLELNKPHVDINLIYTDGLGTEPSRNDNHVEELSSDKGEHAPSYRKDTIKPSTDKVAGETSINETTVEPIAKEAIEKTCIVKNQDDSSIVKDTNEPCICKNTSEEESNKLRTDSSQWASKELLEFVAHMKNGDTSPVSQFDVQTLLLDYIKRNNLRDPHQKSQIICDLRLNNLFGKPRVGHIEMLKLLEFHFLINEDPQRSSFIPAGFVSSVASDADVGATTHGLATPINSRKRKTRKKSEDKQPQNDLNEYAAIDVHNINLIYLRRSLMENLIGDHESFTSKVIGSIVRIRISTNDQKTEVFRLGRVVGTSKVAVPYKMGDRTADVMLEVLNLDKKELVSVNAISNLEFTEDECRRLRQSIRCGLVKQFTVGELQKKALALQSVKVNDWLEAEVMRLNHLRDRASEKGHKKELREYVDRIELLKSPEERQRRISEIPEIHADPKMDPNCESEEDTRIDGNSKKDEHVTPSYSPYPRRGRKSISPNKKGQLDRSAEARSRIIEKTDANGSNGLVKHMNQINKNNSPTGGRNNQTTQRSVLEISTATAPTGSSPSSDNIETEKLWHYRDPNGKIQGPFSMMQLRKWRTTGLFPLDMRIWTNHEQYDSLLLTDALSGKLHGASDLSHKPYSHSQEKGATGELGANEVTSRTSGDNKQTEAVGCDGVRISSEKNPGFVRAGESGSSSWPQCWDLLKDSNPSADDVQAHNSLPSSSAGANVTLTDQGQVSDEVNHGAEKNSTGLTQYSMTGGHELQNQTGNSDQASQPCEKNPRSIKIDLSSNIMESGPVSPPVSLPPDSSKPVEKIEVLDFPSPTPHAKNQLSVSAETCILELLSPTPKSNNEYQEGQATENKQSGFTTFPNSGLGWTGASNLGMGGLQLPEVADEWCGFSPTPARPPSIQEWDSGLVSASSSKPPEVMKENINTSASEGHHLAHAPASQPTTNIPNWLTIMNEPIEFDALGEDSISDLLAEVDAMESQGALPSPTSLKFARELMEDCRDCFSSIEEFSPTPEPRRSDGFSSTTDLQLTPPQCKPMGSSPVDAFDFFKRSSVHSSASSDGETNAPVHSGDAGSEFRPSTPNNTGQDMVGPTMAHGPGSDTMDAGWGSVQGNINLVTVQGNVNLVLGGPPTQGMGEFGWGTNPGTGRSSSNISRSPRNGSLPWDGRKYGGERFSSPRERGYQGRQPWGRQAYGGGGGGGGYLRPLPKGQRICKFYESGHCKKGAFCDFLHP